MMNPTIDFATLMPATKFDTETASALVKRGFPVVEPVMPQILEWLQDRNWPIAAVFEPFLIRIGAPLALYIRSILVGQDDGWKYSLFVGVVAQSIELALALQPELERIAANPSAGESKEEVDLIAVKILGDLKKGVPGR